MARTVSRVRDNDSVRIAGILDMHHATGANQKDDVDRMSVANCEEMDMMLLLRLIVTFWKGNLERGSSRLFPILMSKGIACASTQAMHTSAALLRKDNFSPMYSTARVASTVNTYRVQFSSGIIRKNVQRA